MGIKQLAKLLADEAPEVSALQMFHRKEMEDIKNASLDFYALFAVKSLMF